jgi:hypothetical protein
MLKINNNERLFMYRKPERKSCKKRMYHSIKAKAKEIDRQPSFSLTINNLFRGQSSGNQAFIETAKKITPIKKTQPQ